jgi:hypothetical protein
VERRRFKRIKVKLNAESISGDEKYGVFIEDISETGINMITTSLREHKKYSPGTEIDLKLYLSSGKSLDLRCRVRWSYSKIPPNGLTDCIGIEIIDPPAQYIEFVRSLH